MRKPLAIVFISCILAGCTPRTGPTIGGGGTPVQAHPPSDAPLVATVNGAAITVEQVQTPLIEAHGLDIVLRLAQLELAKQAADRKGVKITDADIQRETQSFLDTTFRDNNAKGLQALELAQEKGDAESVRQIRKELDKDNQVLLNQLLERERMSRPEFAILVRTNTYLRKIVEPTLSDAINDQMLQDGFRFLYGEKVEVRHIQLNNPQEVLQIKKLLGEGQDFADLARRFSRNQTTGPLGGLLPPFSRQDPSLPEAFKEVAFSLKKPGELSDVVNTRGASHLIRLERRIDPKAVKFEDVKDAVRQKLYDAKLNQGISLLRGELQQAALRQLIILNPVLKAQFEQKMNGQQSQIQGKEEAMKKLAEERDAANQTNTTQPTTQATTEPATAIQP